MNVVLYMRYSSDRQTEQSIDGQRRICTEFCKRNGYNIVGTYIDRATSAFKDTDKRIRFNEMIKESDKQLWQAVIVYKLDRFARNRYDSAIYKAKLKKNGVRVISATENISEDPEGVILEAVLEGMAEFYSKELSQKIRRGMHESALKCHSIGGRVPLGYKIVDKKLQIYEPDAEIVREAFEKYASGHTVADLCKEFNSRGYRTVSGKHFVKNSFEHMFRNERYIGTYVYKDMRIEGGVPAIVDKALFDIVQMKLKKNAEAPARGKAKVDYMLSQKLFCGHCGSLMTAETGTSKTGAKHHYYTCSKRKKSHTCDKKNIRKEHIERLVVEDALRFLEPETIEELADMAISANKKDIEKNTIIPDIAQEIREIQKGIDNIVKTIEKGVSSDSLIKRITELEAQKSDAELRLADAQGSLIVLEREQIIWWLSTFTKGDIEDEDYRRRIIDLFVNSVTVWDEPDGTYRITSTYNLTNSISSTVHLTDLPECSTLNCIPPPFQYNPNFLFFWGTIFGFTTKHQR